jgi:O-antigen/teichoic acid export membrane protein
MTVMVVKNIAANLIARVWVAGLQFIFAPLYLYILGPTSYGLVGFYTSVLLALLFLDQAVSPVLTRELARHKQGVEGGREARNTLRTLELLSGSTAVVIGLGLWALSPYIATQWIRDDKFSVEQLTTIVQLMGFTIACQWPSYLYNAGFAGLQRQDVLMHLRIILSTVQWGGAALLLWLVKPDVEVFFYWQVISLALATFVLRFRLWRLMPDSMQAAVFDLEKLKSIWLFAAGSLAVGITGSLLTQADKLLVAKYSSLDQLHCYPHSSLSQLTLLCCPIFRV